MTRALWLQKLYFTPSSEHDLTLKTDLHYLQTGFHSIDFCRLETSLKYQLSPGIRSKCATTFAVVTTVVVVAAAVKKISFAFPYEKIRLCSFSVQVKASKHFIRFKNFAKHFSTRVRDMFISAK